MDKMGRSIVAVLCCFSILSCASKTPSSVNAAAGAVESDGTNVLSSVKIEEDAGSYSVRFSTASVASPNIFKLSDPDRIVVDFSDTKMTAGTNVSPMGQGPISEVNATQFEDGAATLTRVVLSLSAPVEYQAETRGSDLTLRIGQSSPGEVAEGNPSLVTAPVDVTPASQVQPELPAVAPVEVVQDVRPKLTDIRYASGGTGTIVRLLTDRPVDTVQDFMLYDPQRIVIDLKGVENSYSGKKNIKLKTSEVAGIRVGESDGEIRIVLDTTGSKTPSYALDREENALVVTVHSEAVASQKLYEDTAMPSAPELPTAPTAEPALDTAVSPASVSITSVDVKAVPNQRKTRLLIGLSHPDVTYTTQELGDKRFAVVLGNTQMSEARLARPIDTRKLGSPVVSVTPETVENGMQFVVALDQPVPYVVTREGQFLQIDVDMPEVPTQPLKGASTTTAAGEAPERLLPDPTTQAVKAPKKLAAKDYRYVKEEFMNDTILDGDEPLSRMASILGGAVDGKRFTGRKISLDFKDADVRSVFRLIADISKFNIIISDDVDGRITIRLDDVPWDQAFAIILQTRGLWFEKYGNIVRIAPADKLRKERELAAAAQKAAKAAKPLDVLFKPVSFAEAATLMKQVGGMLSERGTVDIDSRTNTLIIKDVREHLEKAKKLVDILDTQTPQVTIEARIVEATTTFTRSFGIQWFGQTGMSPRTGNPTGLFFPNSVNVPFAMNFPIDAGFENTRVDLRLGSINDILDIDLALRLGEQEGHSKLISAPKITVLDNRSATITAGSRIPFITQTANAGSNVRFENAATTLTVTPHITNEGSVLMNISANRNEPNFAQAIQGNPLIDQRSAQTEVLVKSGNTTVIGGIYSTQQANSQSRLPFISKIPLIGALFRNYNKSVRRTELLIFVTPRIVGDEREAVKDVRG